MQVQTILDDAVPAENMAQIQCGLWVSGRAWCDYVSYSSGMPLWVKRVTRDEAWIAAIQAAAEQFEVSAAAIEATVWPWIATGKLTPQIDKTFPLTEAAAAHAYLEGGSHVGKVMLIAG